MKRLLLILVALFCVQAWATPAYVGGAFCSNSQSLTQSVTLTTPWHYKCRLPEPSLAGNLLVLAIASDNTPTLTISDDKSNSWQQAVSADSTHANRHRIYYMPNAATGTQDITVATDMGGVPSDFISVKVLQFSGIATSTPLDVAHCNNTDTTTSITAGSATITTANDLIVEFMWNEGSAATASVTAGSQANITWGLLDVDRNMAEATQYGIFSSTGSFNATMSTGTSGNYGACMASFKAAASGTSPTGMYIQAIHHLQRPASSANPFVIQVPAFGNALIIPHVGGGSTISSVSSSPSNTWTVNGTTATYTNGLAQLAYACNASVNLTMTFTITTSDVTHDSTYMVYDVVGAATSCFDNISTGQTGLQGTNNTNFTMCSSCLTPGTASGLLLGWVSVENNTCGSDTTGQHFDASTYDAQLEGPELVDQNNCWTSFHNISTSAVSMTFAPLHTTTAFNHWAGLVAHFLAPAAGGAPANQFPRSQ